LLGTSALSQIFGSLRSGQISTNAPDAMAGEAK